MYPYQRSISTTSSHAGGNSQSVSSQQQQDHHHHHHHNNRNPSAHQIGSPEQSRPPPPTMSRSYQSVHDDYRQPAPPPHNMHQHHWGPPEPMGAGDRRDHDNGVGTRRWVDDPHQRPYGAPSDRMIYPRQQTHHQQQQQHHHQQQPASHQSHGSYSLSHPTSPSHRPRTPPSSISHSYNSHRPSPWDPSQSGPMSAPPSLVPRVNPNTHATSSTSSSSAAAAAAAGGPSSIISGQQSRNLQTSPTLPSLMRGSKNHSRLPSWGPHSSASNSSISSRVDGGPHSSSAANGSNNHGANPPPSLPFRGQSVGIGDSLGRSDAFNSQQLEKRKRPASESPPNVGIPGGPSASIPQQSSPSSRGDPMSMSSILGPSSKNGEAEKRRRLDGYDNSRIKVEGGNALASSNVPAPSSGKMGAPNDSSTASNLARRKWSGPIAEQAAQQAAAWRAQEQQRWGGASRSPKVGGITPLANEQRHASPVASSIPTPLKQGNSPSTRIEGHKRQRSDGYIQGSPLIRSVPMQEQSPPSPPRQHQQQQQQQQQHSHYIHSREASPGTYHHGLIRSHGGKSFGSSSTTFYRPASPIQQQQHHQPAPPPSHPPMHHQQQSSAPTTSRQYPLTAHGYNQPSYHAYDSQGRPVEVDVEEVRSGAFAGRLSPEQSVIYRESQAFNEPIRSRPAAANQGRGGKQAPISTASPAAVVPASLPAHHAKTHQAGQNVTQRRDREVKQRSTTPNALGPAKGLVATQLENKISGEGSIRAGVPMKDFNQGLKVDNEAVWEALNQVSLAQNEEEERAYTEGSTVKSERSRRKKSRHLGNFQYDPRKSPLLPGDLLQANVGATLEVRVSAKHLGVGPGLNDDQKDGFKVWSLGRGKTESEKAGEMTTEGNLIEAKAFWNLDALIERKLWGTDVYTDDSDVIAMCIHSGWINGPVMSSVPSWVPPGKAVLAWQEMSQAYIEQDIGDVKSLQTNGFNSNSDKNVDEEKTRLDRKKLLDSTADLSVMLRIAPRLIAYKGSQRSGVKSRSWGNSHDGVSLIVEGVTLQKSGYASGERGLRNIKNRIDHFARLQILATIASSSNDAQGNSSIENKEGQEGAQVDRMREKVKAGGMVDIRLAAGMSNANEVQEKEKPFWMISANEGKVLV